MAVMGHKVQTREAVKPSGLEPGEWATFEAVGS